MVRKMTPTSPALHQAPDSAPADASDAPDATEGGESSKRKQVSKRLFLDTSGTPVDKIEEATGARYTLLDPKGNHDFDQQFGDAGKFETMCAIFGFHTKIGNVANTVLNDKEEPGTPSDAASAVADFIKSAQAGTWAERTGGVGVRVDKDALAGSIVAVAEAAGKKADYATIRQKLEEDKNYVRMARQVPAVATEYNKRVGKEAKTLDDLLVG